MIAPKHQVFTVADFRVGQGVVVRADQGWRRGTVTALGRTRVKVRHPRNLQGDMVERTYPMHSIAKAQYKNEITGYWHVVFADGYAYPQTKRAVPTLPTVEPPAAPLVAGVKASWDAGAEQWNYTWSCPCGATDKGALDDEDEAHAEADAHTAIHAST